MTVVRYHTGLAESTRCFGASDKGHAEESGTGPRSPTTDGEWIGWVAIPKNEGLTRDYSAFLAATYRCLGVIRALVSCFVSISL